MLVWLVLLSLGALALGGVACVLPWREPGRAQWVGPGAAIGGAVLGLVPVVAVLSGHDAIRLHRPWELPFASFYLLLDPLAALFLLPVLVVAACAALYGRGYLRPWQGKKHLGFAWGAYLWLVLGMELVVLAHNAVLFLVAWEVTALCSFCLVAFEHERADNRRAAWIYLVASHLGTAMVIALFLLLGRQAGSMDFDRFAAVTLTPRTASAVFVLALVGFGTKAGFIPVHVWLPEAHPAAPSHVSALMSGVMIKTGIYGIVRVLFSFSSIPWWWGWSLLCVGVVSGILGVLLALAQHDLKRLLAYHSVENIGIIAMGLGVGCLGVSAQAPTVAVLGFAGGLLHVVNHAVFKSLLFFGAGSVLHATGTVELDHLGGLGRKLPVTAGTFLVGSVAIAGLPPLNGFVSEFLIYAAAFVALTEGPAGLVLPALVVVAALAMIGGLAAACFAKAFSVVFLGTSRSEHGAHAHEAPPSMQAAMVLPSLACAGIAAASPWLLSLFQPVLAGRWGMTGEHVRFALDGASSWLASILAGAAALLLLVALAAALRRSLLRGRTLGASVTWDCGYAAPRATMQYTASSFAEPLVKFFGPLLRTETETSGLGPVFPGPSRFRSVTPDFFHHGLFVPVFVYVARCYSRMGWIQRGVLQHYVLYIALTLLTLLVWEFY